jgi:hypothetical protein
MKILMSSTFVLAFLLALAGSRDGCTGKSIVDLEKEGRTFDIEDSKKIK